MLQLKVVVRLIVLPNENTEDSGVSICKYIVTHICSSDYQEMNSEGEVAFRLVGLWRLCRIFVCV
jgi:hypothetical protein